MIDRTCPRCRTFQSVYFYRDVPAPYGANTPSAVLAQCQIGNCQHQWRAILTARERDLVGSDVVAADAEAPATE